MLRSGLMQVVFINECKSCEISNQMFFNVMFSLSKTKRLWHKYCKIKVFSGAISHGAANEPEAYLAPSQTSMGNSFAKNS